MFQLSALAETLTGTAPLLAVGFAHVFLSCVVRQAAYERGRCQWSAFFLALCFSPLFGFLWLIAAGSDRKVLRERARQEKESADKDCRLVKRCGRVMLQSVAEANPEAVEKLPK